MKRIVELRGLAKDYQLGATAISALKGLDLDVNAGEFLALAGRSGSGKTTLLNIIGCIERPSFGSVTIDGQDVHSLSDYQLSQLRAHRLGFIFQSFNLLPVLSALENVEYPLSLAPEAHTDGKVRAKKLLELVGLAHVMHHRPLELSGGQRQRVAIARALVMNPKVVLADEPTANLDVTTGFEVLNLMKQINKEFRTTFIFSTHDPQVIELAERVIRISDGVIQEDTCSR